MEVPGLSLWEDILEYPLVLVGDEANVAGAKVEERLFLLWCMRGADTRTVEASFRLRFGNGWNDGLRR